MCISLGYCGQTLIRTDLIHESAQDGQVSPRIRRKDVSCGVDSRHRQDPAGEIHEGI